MLGDPGGQADGPAFGGDQSAGGFGEGEEGGVGGGDEVAGQDEFEASGDRGALDGGDDGLGSVGEGQTGQPPVGDAGYSFGGEGLEVHSGAEVASAPVRTPTSRPGSSSSTRSAASTASARVRSMALRTWGLFKVMTRTPSCRSLCTTGSVVRMLIVSFLEGLGGAEVIGGRGGVR